MKGKPATNMVFVVVSLIIMAIPLFAAAVRIARDPKVPFLLSDNGAQWIQLKRAFNLAAWEHDEGFLFRKKFTLERTPSDGLLTVRALRAASVFLDGRPVLPFNDIGEWKTARRVDLKGLLTPGTHELLINAWNEKGPAVLLAYSGALKLATGKDWEVSIDGINWGPVTPVGEIEPPEISLRFPAPVEALRGLMPLYLPLVLVLFLSLLFLPAALRQRPAIVKIISSPQMVRSLLLGAWALLAVNNITKIPLHVGVDVPAHYEYIHYILEKWRLPFATEGWQMFQSPFYYLVSAVLHLVLSPFLGRDAVELALRLIPLLCGALQVELAYRAMRYVFPARDDFQVTGTLIGGLLPMNLYMSQTVGNEPLAGALSAAAIVMALSMMPSDAGSPSRRKLMLLGTVLGLAVLTKVTAVLLIPALTLFLTSVMLKRKERVRSVIGGILCVLLPAGIVSGWYYIRNWMELGRPFVGGWDPFRLIVWWQDPGYRTFHDFLSFGQSLSRPVFSAIYGFWDSLYSTFWMDGCLSSIKAYDLRPPWNYDFMLSGALLSLLPTVGIVLGLVIVTVRARTAHPGQLFSTYCIGIYFAALLYLYATVPIYSTAKATYTIGLTPCYAIMGATGLNFLSRNRYLSAGIYAFLICWAITAYVSYFVV